MTTELGAGRPETGIQGSGADLQLSLKINGALHDLGVPVQATLLDVLRERLGLTGSKKGCDHGQCRACTVHLNGEPHLSCLTLAATVGDAEVTTIEGLAPEGGLHPMQQAFIEHNALQCGYCTPGQIMSAVARVSRGHAGSDAAVREFTSGNLCRCAAYPHIVATVRSVAQAEQVQASLKGQHRPFELRHASTVQDAVQAARGGVAFLAGGTTLLDLMKLDVMRPERVTAIGRLPLTEVEEREGGLKIGAPVTMTRAAEHPLVAERYPALRDALLSGASQQIRNMASMDGNVMQRTRCGYFRDPQFRACNKRDPGSGCAALNGLNRKHAVLGGETTPGPGACVDGHASNAAVALVALDARLALSAPEDEREVALSDFLLTPGGHPELEHDLKPGELITALLLPAPLAGAQSTYLEVRDRESYEFALASAAVVLKVEDGVVREARMALGGIATVPWRAHRAEEALTGQPATRETFERAAQAELAEARPLSQNGSKVPLATRVLVRALLEVSA